MSGQLQDAALEELDGERPAVVHQALRREVNERTRERMPATPGAPGGTIVVVCECASARCTGRFVVTVDAYEEVRRFPTRFLVKAGHEVLESERIVAESNAYVVVEKSGVGGLSAVRTDPRRRARGLQGQGS